MSDQVATNTAYVIGDFVSLQGNADNARVVNFKSHGKVPDRFTLGLSLQTKLSNINNF